MTAVLEAVDVVVEYTTRHGRVRSLDEASLVVEPGQVVALVGESGSGKTTLGMATGRLLASNARHVGGLLKVNGTSVFDCDPGELRALRHDALAYIFQNPIAALDPTMRIRRQMRLAARMPDAALVDALAEVGLEDGPRVLGSFPHELSGGMAQRVAIAMALHRGPRLLVADEPTAAVDATLRAQILRLLADQCRRHHCALLLLTHDLHAVAEHADHTAVMYGGRVVEAAPTRDVLTDPRHPYTQALIGALPGEEQPGRRLRAISGTPPVLRGPSPGCAFTPRCPHAATDCPTTRPAYATTATGRHITCHLHTRETTR